MVEGEAEEEGHDGAGVALAAAAARGRRGGAAAPGAVGAVSRLAPPWDAGVGRRGCEVGVINWGVYR